MFAKKKKKYVLKTKNPSLFTRKIYDRNKLSPKRRISNKIKTNNISFEYDKEINIYKNLLSFMCLNKTQIIVKNNYIDYLQHLIKYNTLIVDNKVDNYKTTDILKVVDVFKNEIKYTNYFLKDNDLYFVNSFNENYTLAEKVLKYKLKSDIFYKTILIFFNF